MNLTSKQLTVAALLTLGLGLTDLNKTEYGSDHELTPDAMDADALHAKLRRFRPAAIAFTSKHAASLALGVKTPVYGRQAEPLEGAVAFVLASPSGRARSFWTLAPWREAAAFVMERRLMRAIIDPAMIAAWLLGGTMLFILSPGVWMQGWIWVKLAMLVGMQVVHGYFSRWRREFEQDLRLRSARTYRIANEVPTVLLIVIVVMVIVQPF